MYIYVNTRIYIYIYISMYKHINFSLYIYIHTYIRQHNAAHCSTPQHTPIMGWLRLVGSIKLWVSFAKEPCKRDYILCYNFKEPINRSQPMQAY